MNTIKAIDVKEGQLVMFFDEKTKNRKLLVRGDLGDNPILRRIFNNKVSFCHMGDIMDTIDGKDQFVMSPFALDVICLNNDQTIQPVSLSLIVQ